MKDLPRTRCPQCSSKMEHPAEDDIVKDGEMIVEKYFTCDNCGSEWVFKTKTRRMKRVIN